MSTFSTYNNVMEMKLANTSEIFYDEEMKRTEINNTIREIVQGYDLPELTKKTTVTFAATGIASIPTGYFRMVKLWDIDDDSIETAEYMYITEDKADRLSATAAYYWTEIWDSSGAARKLKVWPLASGTLQMRYIASPTKLEDSTTDSGLSDQWDEVVAVGAVFRLFMLAGRVQEAQPFGMEFQRLIRNAWSSTKNRGGIKQNNRLKSRYDRVSLLGGFTVGSHNNHR